MTRDEILTAYLELLGKLDRARAEVVGLELAMRELTDTHRNDLAAIKALLPSPAEPAKRPRSPRAAKGQSRPRRLATGDTQAAIDLQAPLATAA
jgi:hypothetical protein